MIHHIINCPIQKTDFFHVENCIGCKYFEIHCGKHRNYICKKNREPDDKRAFLDICLLHFYNLGECTVEIREE